MSDVAALGEKEKALPAPLSRRGVVNSIIRLAAGNMLGTLGCLLVLLIVLVAVLGPRMVADPAKLSPHRLQNPSAHHWFGTDGLGRDYLARVVYGARVSISLAITAMAIGTTVALVFGMLSAYLGGLVDLVGQRVVDALLAFPGLVMLMLLGEVMGRGWASIAVGLGVVSAIGLTRIVRALVFGALAQGYVESARVLGATPARVLIRHVLPNTVALLFVYASAVVGSAILAEGALAFLGLGVAPPAPSWGRMLADARLQWQHPFLSIFPGLAMTVSVLSFSFLGDSLRDELDPRLRNR